MQQTSTTNLIKDIRFTNIGALIVKVTHRCNLDCSYCYENITKGEDMPIETFKALVDKVMDNSIREKIAFIFHGGEPTLVSTTWYQEAVKYANYKAALVNKTVRYSLQTNLLNVTYEQLKAFKDLEINLGVSVDGPVDIPTPYRKRAAKAISNLHLANSIGLKTGILLNINQTNYQYFDKIMIWLENEIKVRLVKANVAYAVGHGIGLSDMYPEHIHQAYSSILNYMIYTKGTKVVEENMAIELLRFFETKVNPSKFSSLCGVEKCGAGKEVVGVTTEGNILPCGRFEWNNQDFFLGNLQEQITSVVQDKYLSLVKSFHSLVPENWFNCKTCAAKQICSYGCQAFIVRSNSQMNIECIPTKMRYEYLQDKSNQFREVLNGIKQISKFAELIPKSEYGDNAGDNPNYNDTYDDIRD